MISKQSVGVLILSNALFLFGCGVSAQKEVQQKNQHARLIKRPGNGNVQCSMRDKAGNIWFGTLFDGLYKYDGETFRQFSVADGLISNHINAIVQDVDGNIWLGTKEGVCFYDGNTFTPVPIPVPDSVVAARAKYYETQIVHDIMQDRSGKLWFLTIDGIFIYSGKTPSAGKLEFTPFTMDEAASGFLSVHGKAERILQDKAGNIWLGGRTNKGVYRYDGTSVVHFALPEITIHNENARFEKDKTIVHSWGWPQLQDRNGNLWFSNWGGAYRYDGKTFTAFTRADGLAGQGLVAKIIEDNEGTLWFGGEGLCRFDGTSFTCFSEGLINPGTWTVLADKTGNLWVGTRQTGLYLFDGEKFINYSEERQ